MDPRERADAMLARARARGAFVVTPESAVSPMDAASTIQLPRIVVSSNDQLTDPNLVLPVTDGADGNAGETVPAIAQEAFTDVVDSPGIRSRQRRIEEARARGVAARKQAAEAEAAEAEAAGAGDSTPPNGIPAPKQPSEPGSLAERLDG